MSKQQSQKQRPSPQERSGSKPSSKHSPLPNASKKAAAAPPDTQRYAVIITNVENDFGTLHSAALPYYCGLRADFEETGDVERLVNEGGEATRKLVSARRGCGYAVRCRTETRSAEVSFYGPADADFSAMLLQKNPRPPRGASGQSADASKKTTASTIAGPAAAAAAAAASSSSLAAETPGDDPTALTDAVEGEGQAEGVGESTTSLTTNAVEALALRLRRQHYFEDRLPVHVHLPGHAAGDVLLRVEGEDRTTTTMTTAEQTDAHTPSDAKVGEKRPREVAAEEESKDAEVKEEEDDVDDCSSAEAEDGDEHSTAATRVKVEASTGAARDQPAKKHAKTKKAPIVIKQFGSRQKEFVTAVAEPMTPVPLRVMRRRLHDLPGYMSCWSINKSQVRVVFRDAESLFTAKPLLDYIGLGNGVRVNVILSAALSRAYEEHERAREAEGAE